MALFTKETTAKKKISFADQLNSIKESFRTAYNQASDLNTKIQEDIESKEAIIAGLQTTINDFKATQSETQKFMKSLEKFI